MTKEELFKKYSINESHSKWEDNIDNWYSVEIYRETHQGKLPDMSKAYEEDKSLRYITEFIDKCLKEPGYFFGLKNNGNLFMTAKRMVYRFADQLTSP